MFARLLRPLWNKLSTPRALITTSAILTYTLLKNKIRLDSPTTETTTQETSTPTEQMGTFEHLRQYIKQLRDQEVCESKDLPQGRKKIVIVKDFQNKERKIIVMRYRNKLYAFLATCPHEEPFQSENTDTSLDKAIIFNDKLYCPHHGCIFDIKSGSIEHGPTLNNLPIFKAIENEGKVRLLYPAAIPSSIEPNMTRRDVEDLRKVLILGGDDAATIGCANGLRQMGYQGQISVVKQGPYHFPYKKQYLHKTLLNLHLQTQLAQLTQQNPSPPPKPSSKQGKSYKTQQQSTSKKTIQQFQKSIEEQLDEKIYKKLKYYPDQWYQQYGVDLIFNNQPYRIINKQYYPYVSFADGTKMEFDGLLVSTGLIQKLPRIEGITTDQPLSLNINQPENVFSPVRSKYEHTKLNKFLNLYSIKNLLVLGHNIESMQFIGALNKQFPDIKVTVIDSERTSAVAEALGPQLQKKLAKQYSQHGVQFFIKIRDEIIFSNKFSKKNLIKKKKEELEERKKEPFHIIPVKQKKLNQYQPNKYINSIQVRLSDQQRIKADAAVLFPKEYSGNTKWVKNGKYTDFDYAQNDRLTADNFGRTDNIRIFSAGLCSLNDYYLSNKKLLSTDPGISFEQGYNAALNMNALRIPMTFVPFQKFKFFDKTLLYSGTRQFFDHILTIGSVENWDFITLYAQNDKVNAISASPSKAKLVNILRQAMRVNCVPIFEDLLSGYWTIENLVTLIRKLDKSGCYRDLIFANRESIHRKDLIWMERTPDAGFENDRPMINQQYPGQQVGTDGKLKEL